MDDLSSKIFFGINGGIEVYLVKYMLVLLCPRVAAGIWIASISAGFFSSNSSVYGILPFLFPHASILVGSTLNAVADSLSTWYTKDFLIPCFNPFLQFLNSEPAEWIRIGSSDPCTLTRYMRYLSPVMIKKWDSGFLEAYDSACIITGISWLSFLASDERSASLNDLENPINVALTAAVVALDGAMAPVVAVALDTISTKMYRR